MTYEPRTIAYVAELFHPPVQKDPKALQSLHSELFAGDLTGYQNFNLVPGGAQLANPVQQIGAHSTATFMPDRVQVREEFTGITLEDFSKRVEAVIAQTVEHLTIPMFTAHQCAVRTLINPRHFRDSREFIASGMFGFGEEVIGAFDRPAQLVGMRLVFPRSEEQSQVFALRVESYNNDPRSLYLENVGTYPPLALNQAEGVLEEHMQETYEFLTTHALPFVAGFDRTSEEF